MELSLLLPILLKMLNLTDDCVIEIITKLSPKKRSGLCIVSREWNNLCIAASSRMSPVPHLYGEYANMTDEDIRHIVSDYHLVVRLKCKEFMSHMYIICKYGSMNVIRLYMRLVVAAESKEYICNAIVGASHRDGVRVMDYVLGVCKHTLDPDMYVTLIKLCGSSPHTYMIEHVIRHGITAGILPLSEEQYFTKALTGICYAGNIPLLDYYLALTISHVRNDGYRINAIHHLFQLISMKACRGGHIEIITYIFKMMLVAQIPINRMCISAACEENHTHVLDLISVCVGGSAGMIVEEAAECGNVDTFKYTLMKFASDHIGNVGYYRNLMFCAITGKKVDNVQHLLTLGVVIIDINSVLVAISRSSAEVVICLINHQEWTDSKRDRILAEAMNYMEINPELLVVVDMFTDVAVS